jgi:hypothetical protein
MRLHMMGMVRLPDGLIVRGASWPESGAVDQCIRIAGGNRRRGMMIWARLVHLASGPLW